ncbi:transcriptional regulator [Amycolatopsis vancoresmycina DSM 44592]|uniref:Transcriptional regulator n=1 Tax=Amycolatopsis vancoresmycina DSM 44592 TaxID=1292037 RepID=R1I8D1_9PSEU|nr:transcriptional regulator [Amycolatopsis vancoresmycina DSM 44592]
MSFAADEVLVDEDAVDDDVFLLVSSYVKVTGRLGRHDALLAVRGAGDLVGEFAAIDGNPRSATVRACGRRPVVAVRLSAESFWAVVGRDRAAAKLVASIVAGKARASNRRRVDYTGVGPPVRVARLVRELAELYGTEVAGSMVIGLDLTQLELGSFVGVTRATAERALRQLREAGLLETGGRRLVVRDQAGLDEVAAGLRSLG